MVTPSCTHTCTHTQTPHIDLIFVGATDDVLVGDGQGIDTAPSVTLQHVGTC